MIDEMNKANYMEFIATIYDFDGMINKLQQIISTDLTIRQERVLCLYFGLNGSKKLSLEEIGKEFGVDKEEIRETLAVAIRKLRHPTRSRHFRMVEVKKEIVLITLNSKIDKCGFSISTYNCLTRAGISTVGELLKLSKEDLLRVKNLGKKGIEEIEKVIEPLRNALEK